MKSVNRAALCWCTPIVCASAALPNCVRFGCCSLIESPLTAAPLLHPLVSLVPSPTPSFSSLAATKSWAWDWVRGYPLVAPAVLDGSSPCPMFSSIHGGHRGSQRSRVKTLVPPTYTHTHTHTCAHVKVCVCISP